MFNFTLWDNFMNKFDNGAAVVFGATGGIGRALNWLETDLM